MNSFCLRSCSCRSSSLRLEVAAIISSDATPVSTEIKVHEAKAMKNTKKRRIGGHAEIIGPAMSFQSSCVMTLNSVKSAAGTLLKCSRPSSSSTTTPSNSPLPTMCVIRIAETRRNRNSTRKTQTKVCTILINADKNEVSFGNSLKRRQNRASRQSLKCCISGLCLGKTRPKIHSSKMPITTNVPSRIAQPLSLYAHDIAPLKLMRSASSAAKASKKIWSSTLHGGQSGESVSPASSRMLKQTTQPQTVWNSDPSTKRRAGIRTSSSKPDETRSRVGFSDNTW
mmetsp:Transcript_68096/g.158020  ORF Transcript_68096/g.158020 Transcript_68096/m.158020 type:complete len:283 (-) Transcript_68096:110-958(-)